MNNLNVEQYVNMLELLKKALEFYANENHYNKSLYDAVHIDRGHQARFALDKLNEFSNLNQKIEEEYLNEINKLNIEGTSETDMLKIIEDLNNKISE